MLNVIIVDKPFDTLIPALISGEIDFIAAGLSITENRKTSCGFFRAIL